VVSVVAAPTVHMHFLNNILKKNPPTNLPKNPPNDIGVRKEAKDRHTFPPDVDK
jgi:hypothetical protein